MTPIADATVASRKTSAPGLGSRARSGVAWSGASTILVSGLGLITNLVLARLIAPSHFGLLGMTIVFTGLVLIISEMGLASALIRRPEAILDDVVLNTTFWTSAVVSLLLFLLSAGLLAPLVARFYGIPELLGVVIVVSIPLLIRPVVIIHRVLLTRALRFRPLSVVDALSTAVGSALTIALAWAGLGVWSLALTGTLTALASVPLLMKWISWRPQVQFSLSVFREVFSFGSYVTGSQAVVFVSKNVDYLLVGRLLGAHALGVYTLAFLLTDTFRSAIMSVLNKVMYPIYGRLQGDVAALSSYYLQVIRYNTLVIVPPMVVLLVLAPSLLDHVFGSQWVPAAGAARLLAFGVILHTIGGTAAAVLKGIGRANLEFRINITVSLLVGVPALWVGIRAWGIDGAAAAAILYTAVTRFLFQFHIRRLVHVTEWMILRSAGPALAGGLVAGAVGILMMHVSSAGLLPTFGIAAGILSCYVATCALILREEVKLALTHLGSVGLGFWHRRRPNGGGSA